MHLHFGILINLKIRFSRGHLKESLVKSQGWLHKVYQDRKLMMLSGAAASKLPKCKLFAQITSINHYVTNRPTIRYLNFEDLERAATSYTILPENPASISTTPV